MSTWKNRLHEADAALTRELPPERASRLRQQVLAEAEAAARSHVWSLRFALTAGALAAASAALVVSTAIATPESAPAANDLRVEDTQRAPQADSGRQQLHFATPGGTRVIWVFDAEFEVKGTLP